MKEDCKFAQRYVRNSPAITPKEQQALASARVCVCGCGGLGGYAVELLARIGVGTIVVVDGDAFDATNLNRQLYACEDNLGQPKARAAFERVAKVNSRVTVLACDQPMTSANASSLLSGCDIAIDALDSHAMRLELEKWCADANIPMVHGAVCGWFVQASVIAPKSRALEAIYPDASDEPEAQKPGTLSFAPAYAAAIEVCECVKVLLGKGDALYGKLLVADMLHNTRRIIDV